MWRIPLSLRLGGVLAGLLLLGLENRVLGQAAPNAQKVKFETDDGVELNGHWYPSPQKNSPCVLLLHSLGEDTDKGEWRNLAKTLQGKGFAVLMFDFRGHGNSTSINDPAKFFAYNSKIATIKPGANTLAFKDYSPMHYPIFVNDIAAAKAFLDLKNDAGECNSSSLVLVGANTGGTLGAIWMKSEWYRYPTFRAFPNAIQQPNYKEPAGKNIMAAIFLSVSGQLGKNEIKVPTVLTLPVKTKATPALFIYNEAKNDEKVLSEYCGDKLKEANGKKYNFHGSYAVKALPKLTGADLLDANLNSDISKWLDNVTNDGRVNTWVNQNFTSTYFVWALGNTPNLWVPATSKQGGAKTFNFYNFAGFGS